MAEGEGFEPNGYVRSALLDALETSRSDNERVRAKLAEGEGFGPLTSRNSRIISTTRCAQSTRLAQIPRSRYKTGTAEINLVSMVLSPPCWFSERSGCCGFQAQRPSAEAPPISAWHPERYSVRAMDEEDHMRQRMHHEKFDREIAEGLLSACAGRVVATDEGI